MLIAVHDEKVVIDEINNLYQLMGDDPERIKIHIGFPGGDAGELCESEYYKDIDIWHYLEFNANRPWNIFGVGRPDISHNNNITIQANPSYQASRSTDAVLARDQNGNYFLCHKLKLGGNYSGRSDEFRETYGHLFTYDTIRFPNGKNARYAVICGTHDDDARYKIATFVHLVGAFKAGTLSKHGMDSLHKKITQAKLLHRENTGNANEHVYTEIDVQDTEYHLLDETDILQVAKATESTRVARHKILTNAIYRIIGGRVKVCVGVCKDALFDVLLRDYSQNRDLLIEAKGSMDRAEVRLAIGQLYDYRLHGFDQEKENLKLIDMAVLLPEIPDKDTVNLVQSAGISVLWISEETILSSDRVVQQRLNSILQRPVKSIHLSKQCASPDRVIGVSPTAENVGCRKLDSGGRDQAVRLAW